MSGLLMIWLAISSMTVLIFWGSNLAVPRKFTVITWVVVLLLMGNVVAQYKADPTLVEQSGQSAPSPRESIEEICAQWGMHPGQLRHGLAELPPQIILSTFVNVGWLPLLSNIWILVLVGSALETVVGWGRMTMVLLAGLLVPPLLDGAMPVALSLGRSSTVGGASGLVYAVLGAALCCLPHVRFGAAISREGRFWAWTLAVLGGLSLLIWPLGGSLVEVVLICGMPAAIYLLQPKVQEVWAPVGGVLAYKLAVDGAVFWPYSGDILANSLWRIAGGAAVGAAMVLLQTHRGGSRVFGWTPRPEKGASLWRRRSKAAPAFSKIQEDSARTAASAYLAQRVFLGDAAAVVEFYPAEVMKKYPDIVLPEADQWHLARVLANKGRTAEALHAYTNLTEAYPISPDQWEVWLIMAELALKSGAPDRVRMAEWLEKFLSGEKILLRDRLEAQRLLEQITATPPSETAAVDAEPEQKLFYGAASADGPSPAEAPAPLPVGAIQNDAPPGPLPPPEPLEMPRLAPATFDAHGKLQNRSVASGTPLRTAKLPEDNLARQQWKLHAVRERLDPDLLLQSPRSSSAAETAPSGFYGTDQEGRGQGRGARSGRMAKVEIARRTTFLPEILTGRNPLEESNFHASPPVSSRPYGAAADAPEGAEKPRIRLKREANSPMPEGH